MARKKSIKLASTTVHHFHDLDADRVAKTLERWQCDEVTPLGLVPRPEREYNEDLLSLSLKAGSENGFNPSRSHYRKILADILESPTQMSLREARALWIVETRPGKFADYTYPTRPSDTELDKPLDKDEVVRMFGALLDDLHSVHMPGARIYSTQTILAALMSRLIGTSHTLEAWTNAGITPRDMPNFFPYLNRPEDDEDEARILELIQTHREQGASDEYQQGAIAYCLSRDEARMWCDSHNIYVSATHRTLCRLAACPDKWADALCRSSKPFRDEDSLYEAIALANSEQLATLASKASEVGGVNDCKRAMKRLFEIHDVALVAPMLTHYRDDKLGKLAETWLISEGANAIYGLAELAEDRTKQGKLCIELLRRYRDLGHSELITQITDAMDEQVQKVVHKHVLDHYSATKQTLATSKRPDWLTTLMQDRALAKKTLPAFLTPETLPPLQTRQKELLSSEDVAWFIRVLKVSSLHEPHENMSDFREWLDPWTTTAFVEALIRSWERAGSNASYAWVIEAIGHVGNLYSPLMLEPLIKGWKSEKSHTRRALEECALSTLETLYAREKYATALAVLVRQNVSSRYSRHAEANDARKARRQRLADLAGVPWRYVKDLCIPDLGFNERGERDFDYGTRHFRLRLGEDLTPEFVDEQGNTSQELPHVRKSDDQEKAEHAREAFRRDRALLDETLQILHDRLTEYDRAKKSDWPVAIWRRLFLDHPLTKNFARTLLWRGGVMRDGEKPVNAIFRITEDFKLVDVEDEDVTLKAKGRVALMSRDGFTEEEREQWASILVDYEIIQPFEQI